MAQFNATELAKTVEDSINSFSFNEKEFAQEFKKFHPTLQQKFFRVIREVITVQADDNRYYDGRNEASHKMAKNMLSAIENNSLPFV